MSEDRLEKALEGMRNENVSAGAACRGACPRVGEAGERRRVALHRIPARLPRVPGWRGSPTSRRLLMEDHLSRCPQCRAQLAAHERRAASDRRCRTRQLRVGLPRWGAWAAAAALVLVALYLGRDRIDTMLAPGGPRATVASVTGPLYRVPAGALANRRRHRRRETGPHGPGARAVLRLADGSLVDVNERTELFVRAAWSGQYDSPRSAATSSSRRPNSAAAICGC